MESITYRRKWRCEVSASGFSVGSKCSPGDPHGGDWYCQWVLEAPILKDMPASRELLAKQGIEVEDQ